MGFFAKLKKRDGLVGAIVLYGILRFAPWALIIFAMVLAVIKAAFAAEVEAVIVHLQDWMVIAGIESFTIRLPDWTGLMALGVGSFAFLLIGALHEGRINDKLAASERAAKTSKTTTAEVVEVAEVTEAKKPTPTNDLEERDAMVKTPETTAAEVVEVAETQEPTSTKNAPTIEDKNTCLFSKCKRTRHSDKPLCPECWEEWTTKKPWRCVKCNNKSPAPLCPSCHPKWLEWLKS